jgi:hypothetical protein
MTSHENIIQIQRQVDSFPYKNKQRLVLKFSENHVFIYIEVHENVILEWLKIHVSKTSHKAVLASGSTLVLHEQHVGLKHCFS